MKRISWLFLIVAGMCCSTSAQEQVSKKLSGADERFKADILVVVAHPDDEGAVTPYLARAIYDLHKRVAVVYGTHGSSGGNSYGSERAGALGDIREIEAREACARLGIRNVWFLDGKDTASQNVLNSLANWGHGANLEKMVQLIRLIRPEVVITSLPGVFIGENHGDHQATGVIATEAFDLAGDATIFPEQVAGASPKRELYLENLRPWTVSKIYYFADANDDKQFAGSGPAYSIKEVSPSQKKPYWRLAIDAAMTHLTQYPQEIHALEKLGDAELEKRMSDPDTGWWSEPETLIFGKSTVGGAPTDDVFAKGQLAYSERAVVKTGGFSGVRLSIGGPWGYYEQFRAAHGLDALPVAKVPEIGIKAGTSVYVPLTIHHATGDAVKVTIRVEAPAGWKVTSGEGEFALPAESSTEMRVELDTPQLSADELKKMQPQLIVVRAEVNGQPVGEVKLRVSLRQSALPQ
ncbi:MAG TPA: PIG-L family deacetylase [Candidatus Acidoferrum sp.]|nr:PIG-L family deacetylase [Candidatus Acidoferrum sp.]